MILDDVSRRPMCFLIVIAPSESAKKRPTNNSSSRPLFRNPSVLKTYANGKSWPQVLGCRVRVLASKTCCTELHFLHAYTKGGLYRYTRCERARNSSVSGPKSTVPRNTALLCRGRNLYVPSDGKKYSNSTGNHAM